MKLNAVWAAADLESYSGCYSMNLLSLYEHVANFQIAGWPHLFFIGDQQLARGPASIGITAQDFRKFKDLLRSGNSTTFEDGRVIYEMPETSIIVDRRGGEKKSFAPVFNIHKNNMEISPAVDYYLAELKDIYFTSPSAVLLDRPGGCKYHRQAFNEHYPALIQSLVELDKKEIVKNCRSICGMGYGLTPTGDDLIHAAFVVTGLIGPENRELLDSMYHEIETLSAQTGLFGRHMIEIGRRCLTPEPFLNYLEALGKGLKAPGIVKDMVRIGSTTGYDLAVGMTFTLQKYLNNGGMLDR